LARKKFEPIVRECVFHDPQIPIVSNVDGKPLKNGVEAPQKLIDQLCGSVLWKQSIEWMLQAGHNQFVEVGPKKVLRGLMRKIDRNAKVLSVEDPASLAGFLQANQ